MLNSAAYEVTDLVGSRDNCMYVSLDLRLGDESEEMGGCVIGGHSVLENKSHLIL